MEPTGSRRLPAQGGIYGIGVKRRFAVEVSFDEPDTFPTANVNGGIEDHRLIAGITWRALVNRAVWTNAATSANPSGPLFSG
jgi:hypothetical protein